MVKLSQDGYRHRRHGAPPPAISPVQCMHPKVTHDKDLGVLRRLRIIVLDRRRIDLDVVGSDALLDLVSGTRQAEGEATCQEVM